MSIICGQSFLIFWVSRLTKLGDGALGLLFPAADTYLQILPKAMEMVSYDLSQLALWQYAVMLAGTWADFLFSV